MKKKLLIGLLILGMLSQSFAMPVLAAEPRGESVPESTVVSSEQPEESAMPSEMPEEIAEPMETPVAAEESSEAPSEMPEVTAEPTEESVATEKSSEAPSEMPEEVAESAETPVAAEESSEAPSETPEATAEPAEEAFATEETSEESSESPVLSEEETFIQLSDAYVFQAGGSPDLDEADVTDGAADGGETGTDPETGLQTAVDQDAVDAYIYQQLMAKNSRINLEQFAIPFERSVGNLIYNVVNENPDLYFVNVGSALVFGNNTIVTYATVSYYDSYDIAAFDAAVEEALSALNDSMSSLQKAIALHEYMVLNCKYDTGSPIKSKSYNAYGALVDGVAVCQGYALAYKYLLNKAGVACYMVTSDTMNHAWNMVKTDGQYYHVDATFDDPLADRIGYVRHHYLLRSDAAMLNGDHEGWKVVYKNKSAGYKATSTAYDNAFWDGVNSPLVIKGNDLFYISDASRAIVKRSMSSGAETVLYQDFEKWKSIDGKYIWNYVCSGLFLIGERLYFNSPDYIYSIDLTGGNGRVETNKLSTAQGYVYGSACIGGSVKYALHANYSFSGEETVSETKLLHGEGIPVNKILLDKEEVKLSVGETAGISAKVYPSYVNHDGITWKSSNPSVATVENGVITAVKDGTATITASVGGVSASCLVSVRYRLKKPVFTPYTPFRGDESSGEDTSTIDKGAQVTITAENGAVIYYTTDGSKPALAVTSKTKEYTAPITVSKNMTIKAIAVRADVDTSEVTTVNYIVCTNNLVLGETTLTMTEGESKTLQLTELPTTKTLADVTFTSSNSKVASVDAQGQITALYEGTATITAQVTDHQGREVKATCEVTVEPPVYTVTFMGKGSNIPIKTEKVKARRSATPPEITLERTPEGYYFIGWRGNYTNVQADTVIQARFQAIIYTIDYELGGGVFEAAVPDRFTIEHDDILLPEPTQNGMKFAGWYLNESFTGSPVVCIEGGSVGDVTLYAKWVNAKGLWFKEATTEEENVIPAKAYTGKEVKPSIQVYYGDKLLKKGTDYTISYKNNVKANLLQTEKELAAKPAVVITGEGNYKGTLRRNFVIEKKALSDSDIQIDNLAVAYNKGKAVKPVPAVKWKDTKLVYKTDFTVSYPDSEENLSAYKEPGTYRVIVKAKAGGNFCGEKEITLTIAKPAEERLISKATVTAIGKKNYTGEAIKPTAEQLKLTYGKKKTPLVPEVDYTVKYDDANDDYTNIGTHQIIIEGLGKYVGQRRVSFQIKGTDVSTMKIKVPVLTYDGTAQMPPVNPPEVFENGVLKEGADLSGKIIIRDKNGQALKEGEHFTLKFSSNKNAGTAKLTVKSMGPYTGSVTKEFTIKKASLGTANEAVTAVFASDAAGNGAYAGAGGAAAGGAGANASGADVFAYQKGGTKPKVVVTFRGQVLKEGTDYTLSYANNTAVRAAGDNGAGATAKSKAPTVTITGNKNFTGSRKLTFSIEKQDLSAVKISAPDKVASSKAGAFYSTPVLTDVNGKKLVAGTDYKKTYVYKGVHGNVLNKKDKLGAGETVTVIVTGKGNYTGTASTTYRIIKKSNMLSEAKVSFTRKFYYTGEKVVLSKDDLVVKVGGKPLTPEQYEIVSTSYKNNVKCGTAKVTIKGKGEYGGTKTISFTINRQTMKW